MGAYPLIFPFFMCNFHASAFISVQNYQNTCMFFLFNLPVFWGFSLQPESLEPSLIYFIPLLARNPPVQHQVPIASRNGIACIYL